jgi:hypothetical protein
MSNPALARLQKALKRRIALIELLSKFLEDNPEIASRSALKQLGNSPGLVVEEKALVRPGGTKTFVLRLERYMEDNWQEYELNKRIVCADIARLGPQELAAILRSVKIDLSKPPKYEDEDAEDEESED